jgi:hypothetical protein
MGLGNRPGAHSTLTRLLFKTSELSSILPRPMTVSGTRAHFLFSGLDSPAHHRLVSVSTMPTTGRTQISAKDHHRAVPTDEYGISQRTPEISVPFPHPTTSTLPLYILSQFSSPHILLRLGNHRASIFGNCSWGAHSPFRCSSTSTPTPPPHPGSLYPLARATVARARRELPTGGSRFGYLAPRARFVSERGPCHRSELCTCEEIGGVGSIPNRYQRAIRRCCARTQTRRTSSRLSVLPL